ncbi:hypothetical protein [Flavivirga jejuensis]|uniref:PD-(D/E)XK nuclease superfamily protein n=1 Tax=Flavivirga jejuensis TaxID=870487 RepID=A0ABT8WV64_9FLAO|nr:hypothetical protein [Flavivirga jejuensis]MDO5977086.1 hypothetical protein [Flavivirga jejuensis]
MRYTLVLNEFSYQIYEAMQKVDAKYSKWKYHMEGEEQEIERVFAYELYHQIRLKMESDEQKYSGLQLNGEISKIDRTLELNQHQYKGFDSYVLGRIGRTFNVQPDLVLHKAQNNREFNWQKSIVEIKTGRYSDFNDVVDILKLLNYIEQLNFQNGIFIAANKDIEEFEKLLKDSFSSSLFNKKCFVFYYNITHKDGFPEPIVQYKSLETILN